MLNTLVQEHIYVSCNAQWVIWMGWCIDVPWVVVRPICSATQPPPTKMLSLRIYLLIINTKQDVTPRSNICWGIWRATEEAESLLVQHQWQKQIHHPGCIFSFNFIYSHFFICCIHKKQPTTVLNTALGAMVYNLEKPGNPFKWILGWLARMIS